MSALTYEQDPSYYLDSSSKKKKGRHRKLDTLTYETIREYFVYTQSQAAKKLGVSVSTLKRKFYSLGYENRWPYIRTVTPKKKGMNNKRSHEDSEDEEVSAEEEEYEESEEEIVREPMTRSAGRKTTTSSPVVTEQNKKKRKVEETNNTRSVDQQVGVIHQTSSPQSSPSSRIGFSSTSSAFVPISPPKAIEQPIVAEEEDNDDDDEEEEYYIASEEEEEPIMEEENNEEEEQEPIIVIGGNKEATSEHLNNSNISFSDMSTYAQYPNHHNGSILNTSFTTTHRLYNEQSQASNQSQDFGDEVVAASMLFQFAADKKKFSSPRILPPISSLHSTNFMDYHAQPLKKRIPSLGDYRNFNSRTSSSYQSSNNSSSCTPIASEGLILPPIKNLIRGDEVQSIGFNNHQHMVKQHIS